ncbi:MAG: hypothetical protein ABJ275_11460 [Maricaulaceae bacterium]
MTKQILFWTGVFTAISIWLGWPLRAEADPIGHMATVLPLANVAIFAAGFWLISSEKHKNSARGFSVAMMGPALMTIIILGAARFLPSYFNLALILAFHLLFIAVGNYTTTSTTWISGFPTFWNVKDSALWGKSQRFFGRGLVLISIISLVASLILGKLNAPILIGGVIALLILGNIHSWWNWKQSQNQAQNQAKG